MEQCVHTWYQSPIGRLVLGATGQGICWLGFSGDNQWAALQDFLNRQGMSGVSGQQVFLKQAVAEISDYLTGGRREFSVPLDLRGTRFQREVWTALGRIPFGRTTSYSRLAAAVGRPRAARAVGLAAHRNPVPIIVPCHRLIGAAGALTGFGGGLDLKRKLLRHEGVALERAPEPGTSRGGNVPAG
ncbi:MAG: methylated-DNA--[protein]-cysteine S-methyltransferase [Acidobacteria bacterium]|nr:methylated-DNA--[protein]-cysteine S-methyltransferase [Acidobacteriota bacterium]